MAFTFALKPRALSPALTDLCFIRLLTHMRVLCNSDFINPGVSDLVSETGQHVAWTPNLRDHLTLVPTRERSIGDLKLHTAPLEERPLRGLRDALAPLLPAVGPALPKPVIGGLKVLVTNLDASDIWRDPGSSKGLRVYCSAKAIATAQQALVDVLTPYIPGLKCLELLDFVVTVVFQCGDKIYAQELNNLHGHSNEA